MFSWQHDVHVDSFIRSLRTNEIKIQGDLTYDNIEAAMRTAKPTNNSAKWVSSPFATLFLVSTLDL